MALAAIDASPRHGVPIMEETADDPATKHISGGLKVLACQVARSNFSICVHPVACDAFYILFCLSVPTARHKINAYITNSVMYNQKKVRAPSRASFRTLLVNAPVLTRGRLKNMVLSRVSGLTSFGLMSRLNAMLDQNTTKAVSKAASRLVSRLC